MKKIVSLLLITVILAGCAVFQSPSEKQTVMVDKTASDTINVTFCGNAYMSQKEVERYALQRASTEALSKGCSHFVIVDKLDKSKMCSLNSGSLAKDDIYNDPKIAKGPEPFPDDFVEPNVTLTIRCIKDGQSASKEAIDARNFLKENFPDKQG